MKKKFFAMYALAGALVASPVFTSCVDDSVSPQVEAQREAKAELLKSEAALNKAKAEAETIRANADAALNNAIAALRQAEAEYKAAQTAWEKADNEIDLEDAKIKLEAAKRAEEIAKANAEMALEKAKLEAENALLAAQKENLQNKLDLEKVTEGLANEEKIKADYINCNIKAIMSGGSYYMLNTDGGWSSNKFYSSSYWYGNTYTSIQGLIQGLADEKVNLVKLQNDLIDIEEYLVEKKADNDEIIATKTALIAKYKELQAASNREAMEKAYEEAKTNAEDLTTAVLEKQAEKLTADNAYKQHKNIMMEDPIQKLANHEEYLTAIEVEEALKDTIVSVGGITRVIEHKLDAVYEHAEEDAEELAEDIANVEKAIDDKKKEIAELEAKIAEVNIADIERVAVAAKAEADETLKKYEDVKASEAYKKVVADLEKKVADAQAAFDKNPTGFATYTEVVENADGTATTKTIKSTKTLLNEAEDELDAVVKGNQYNYGTEEEPAWLYDLYNKLYVDQDTRFYEEEWWLSAISGEGLIELAENLAEVVKSYKEGNNGDLERLNGELEDLNESLEALKELQAMLVPESEEMKAYLALCEAREELQKAQFALQTEIAEMNINEEYWNTLKGQLESYVGDGETTEGSLPNYEEFIAEAEKAIKDAEQENENIETATAEIIIEKETIKIETDYIITKVPEFDEDGNIKLDEEGNIIWKETVEEYENENSYTSTTTNSVSKTAKEAEIAKKTAEIAAMEAELEIRQKEYDAEVAALKALVGTTEE